MMNFIVRPLVKTDRDWVRDLLIEHWGSSKVITRGKIHYADKIPGFAAIQNNEPAGLITYELENQECEIISLNSLSEGIGIGTALLKAVEKVCRDAKYGRLWLITTNDNIHALRFYQKIGLFITAIHLNAIAESRKLKPEIPDLGMHDIPIRDEIELEIKLF